MGTVTVWMGIVFATWDGPASLAIKTAVSMRWSALLDRQCVSDLPATAGMTATSMAYATMGFACAGGGGLERTAPLACARTTAPPRAVVIMSTVNANATKGFRGMIVLRRVAPTTALDMGCVLTTHLARRSVCVQRAGKQQRMMIPNLAQQSKPARRSLVKSVRGMGSAKWASASVPLGS